MANLTNNIRVLQWNARGIRNKLDIHSHSDDFDVIIIIESKLKKLTRFNIRGFDSVRFDRETDNGGGIVFFVRSDFIYNKINMTLDNEGLEIGAISVKSNIGIIHVIACYRNPTDLTKECWNKVTNTVSKMNPFLLLDVFNAHHDMGGDAKNCPSGKVIAENFDYDNLFLMNDGSYTLSTTRNLETINSCIDISFASHDLFYITNWKTLDCSWGSDHIPISITINITPSFLPKTDYRYNFNKLDWKKNYTNLENNKYIFNSIDFLDLNPINRYEVFVNVINDSIKSALNYKHKDFVYG